MTTVRTTLEATDRAIDADLLERPVAGYRIAESATLGSVLGPQPGSDAASLLVFLRHFG